MQPVISIDKKTQKKTKFAALYPKRQATYIVAFAVNENIKTPTGGDVIENKTNLQTSTIPVTPSTCTNTFTFKKSKQNMGTTLEASDSITRIQENYSEGENETSLNNINCLKINEVTLEPKIIFFAQKHTRTPKFDVGVKRRNAKKTKRVVIIKNIHYKNQCARNMTTKLKRYCKKKKTFNITHEMHGETEYDSISKRVSRSCILKKVLAKENFLAKTEINEHESRTSSPFSADPSFMSVSSQGTLTRGDSPNSANSIIEISNPKMSTYKTNIINIAVAQINNTPNLNRKSYSIIVPHTEKVIFKDSLTSYESAFSQTLILTSKSFLENTIHLPSDNTTSDASCSNNNISNETLIPPIITSKISRNFFQIDHSLHSNVLSSSTLKCNHTNQSHDYKSMNDFHNSNEEKNKEVHTRTFYDACMTFDLYPKTPCTSSVPEISNNDNVIIAEDIIKTNHHILKLKNRGDERYGEAKNDLHANIFQKPFNVVNAEDYQKNVNLPNAAQIRNTLVDTSRTPRKCSQEVQDYPTSFPELCDKLTIVLEIAVKKLEQTLSEKIVNELKRSLYEFDKHIQSITTFQKDTSEYITEDIKLGSPTKSRVTLKTIPCTDAYLQCDIVQNEVIDKLMLVLGEDYSKCYVQSSSSNYTHKLKKPKLVKNYFEILKDPISPENKEQEVGKGDSVQISIEDSVDQQAPRFDCRKTFWSMPITILRENVLVVASVPAFLFVMFVLYSYIMLLIKMWWY